MLMLTCLRASNTAASLVFLSMMATAMISNPSSSMIAWGFPDKQQVGTSTSKCPFARRRTQEAFELMANEAETRMEDWLELEKTLGLEERLYVPGEQNDGEEYCDGSDDNRFCNKIYGAWGDSIPQDETYCLWAVLEFQDPISFGYGMNGNDNFTQFNELFEAAMASIVPLMEEGKVLYIGATGGVAVGQPEALPWPTATIVWNNGNLHAKDWIINVHRPYQLAGYDWGFVLRAHYKAVQCVDIEPMLEKQGLLHSNGTMVMTTGSTDDEHDHQELWNAPGVIGGTVGFRKFWNAFAELRDYSPLYYQPEEPCVLGPCPLEVVAAEEELNNVEAETSAAVAYGVATKSLLLALVFLFV